MMRKLFLSLAIVFAMITGVRAAYLENVPRALLQPNGDTLHCFATGDEYYHFLHDADGYTIVQDPATGYFVYADKVGNQLVATSFVAGMVNPAEVGLVPHLNISAEEWMERRQAREAASPMRSRVDHSRMNHGKINNIVVFIRFSDDTEFTNSFSTVNAMFNDSTPGRQSQYNYFKSVSYNQLEIESHFYPQPNGNLILSYQDIYPRSYYNPYSASNPNGYQDGDQASREHPLLKRAIDYIADMVPADLNIDNDGDGCVDNVVFVIRGNVGDWNDLLWPHKWTLYTQSCAAYINGKRVVEYNIQLADNSYYFSVSTLCHEMNHTLGAPDLYHYYTATGAKSVGPWDLMHDNARPPQNMGAYMKYRYGTWIDEIPLIDSCGTYTLYSLGSSATKNCYKIAGPTPNEFFVLEYRNTNDYFDSSLPRSGLLIYRINNRFSGNAYYDGTSSWDEVYIYRPNNSDSQINNAVFSSSYGRSEFHSTTNPRPFMTDGSYYNDLFIHQITAAGGDSIMFTYCAENYIGILDSEVILEADSGSAGTFRINSDLEWTITNPCDWLEVSPMSGTGSLTVNVTAVAPNEDYEARECVLVAEASNGDQRTVTIHQDGVGYILEIELDTNYMINNLGAEIVMTVRSNFDWQISASESWLSWYGADGTHAEPQREYIDVVYLYPNTLNESCVRRLSSVTLSARSSDISASRAVTVFQDGAESVLLPAAEEVPIANTIDATGTLQLTASASWTLTATSNWLIVAPTSGTGNATINLSVSATNSGASPRNAYITFRDECGNYTSVRVEQGRGYIDVVEDSLTLYIEEGSSATAAIRCTGDWRLIANSCPDWLEVTPAEGSLDGSITVRALTENNWGEPRSAELRFIYGVQRDTLHVVQLNSGVGLAEAQMNACRLYPNPAQTSITVEAPTVIREIAVYDLAGRAVMRETAGGRRAAINVSGLQAGLYIVEAVCDGCVERLRLVVGGN